MKKQKHDWNKIYNLARVIMAFVLTLPLIIAHFLMFANLGHEWMGSFEWYSLFATFIVQFIFGYQYYIWGFKEIFINKKWGMNSLIVIATGITFIWSLGLFIYTQIGGNLDFDGNGMNDYSSFFEVGASVIAFVLLGGYITDYLYKKVTNDVESLVKLQVSQAYLYNSKTKSSTPIEAKDIKIGDLVSVKNNTKIPVDGILVSGNTYVNETILTGEAKPSYKSANDQIFAGTINLGSNIIVKATVDNANTVLSSIINKVTEIQSQKPKIQKIADTASAWFIPIVLILSVAAFLINFFFGVHIQEGLGVSGWVDIPHFVLDTNPNYVTINLLSSIFFSIAMIAIACPCALGLATPLAVVIGVGIASKNNIIFNTKEIFEKIKYINAVAFDKTGTLTVGKLKVINTSDSDGVYNDIVYSLESQSIHPLADSLVEYFKERKAKNLDITNVKETIGFGLQCNYKKSVYIISSVKKLMDAGCTMNLPTTLPEIGVSQLGLAKDNKIVAVYYLKDEINRYAKEVIKYLHDNGIETYMITGDITANAEIIAKELNIKHVYSNVKPDDKGNIIDEIKAQGKSVAYVGDGINDLIAFKKANLSISVSLTNESAKELSDLSITNGDILNIYKAIKITKLTRRNIIYNFIWAFGYNLLTIPLAFLGIIPMIVAPIVMGFSDASLIINALVYRRIITKQINRFTKY